MPRLTRGDRWLPSQSFHPSSPNNHEFYLHVSKDWSLLLPGKRVSFHGRCEGTGHEFHWNFGIADHHNYVVLNSTLSSPFFPQTPTALFRIQIGQSPEELSSGTCYHLCQYRCITIRQEPVIFSTDTPSKFEPNPPNCKKKMYNIWNIQLGTDRVSGASHFSDSFWYID